MIQDPIAAQVIKAAKPTKKDRRWYRKEYLTSDPQGMDVQHGKDDYASTRPWSAVLRDLERLHK